MSTVKRRRRVKRQLPIEQLIARINIWQRKKRGDESFVVRKTEDSKIEEWGRYHVWDAVNNKLRQPKANPEKGARFLGLLAKDEEVVL
jgi:hypothetical protein